MTVSFKKDKSPRLDDWLTKFYEELFDLIGDDRSKKLQPPINFFLVSILPL